MLPSTEFLFNDRRSLHEQRFRRLKTLKAAYILFILQILFLSLICGVTFRAKLLFPWNDLSSLYFCQALFWTFSLIFHFIFTKDHWYLRIRGHFTVYKMAKDHSNLIISIPSLFNVLIIIIQAVSNKYIFSHEEYLKLQHEVIGGILIFQLVLTSFIVIRYIVIAHKFNHLKPVPDTEQNDYFLLSDASSSSEIGYRLDGEAMADLLEKQADLILYLKSTIHEMNDKFTVHSQ